MDGGRWPAPKDTAASTTMEAARATAGGDGQRWRAAPRGVRQSAWQREGGAATSRLGRRRGGGKQQVTRGGDEEWLLRRASLGASLQAKTRAHSSIYGWGPG
jgi:hypothetical protein